MSKRRQKAGTGDAVPLQIILAQPDEPLVELAAEELQRYVRRLFGFNPLILRCQDDARGQRATGAAGSALFQVAILVGAEPAEALPDQGYVIRPVEWRGCPALSLAGGSPRAVLWAAYEVAAAWGVHYLVQGDVFPDDVGPFHLPQLDCRREYGLAGFSFRQFDISQHEPAMAYMVEAAWGATVTPEDSYRRYALRVAGEEAADDLLAAFHGVEELTEAANSLMGLGFMWPSLYSKHWEPGTRPDPAWQEYTAHLAPVEAHLKRALAQCAPRGRKLIDNYLHFVRFAGLFVRTSDLIRQARAAYDQAQEAWKARDHVAFHPLIGSASDLLFQAQAASEEALRIWAAQVADPTDLGSLAGLNAYGHDWLRGKCVDVYWESQCYGFKDMG